MKKKALLSSILVIVLCVSVIAGSTLALFTSHDELNISVTSAQVKLSANIKGETLQTWSDPFKDNPYYSSEYTVRNAIQDGNEYYSLFDNGGEARITDQGEIDAANVVITRMTPGDVAKFTVDVKNESNVNVQYRIRMVSLGVNDPKVPDLTDVLITTAYIDGALYEMSDSKGNDKITPWRFIDKDMPIEDFEITVYFPDDGISIDQNGMLNHDNIDNDYQNGQANIAFVVEAVQANGVPFESPTNLGDLTDGSYDNVITDGAYNGEGQEYDVSNSYLVVNEFASFANIDLTSDSDSILYATSDYSDGSTIILADGANLEVADGTNAISIYRGDRFATDTVVIDEEATVTFGQGGGVLMAMYANAGGELNLVLNGVAANECIVAPSAADLSCAFAFAGYDNATTTINILVKDAASVVYYAQMIDPASYGVTIQWYVDGVAYGEPDIRANH